MRIRRPGTAFGVSLALLIALCCLAANAQSGRRQAKPPPAAPVPSPTPEPTPKPKREKTDGEADFFVATGHRGAFVSVAPIGFHDAATTGCAEQLRKRTSLDVAVSLQEVSRGEAIAKAKAGKSTYVVLVSLVEDRLSASQSPGYIDYEVDYVVFAPETAKVLSSGRTYEGTRRGPITVGPRGPGVNLPSYREAQLRKAGEAAADRIVKNLHLSDPKPGK